MADRPALVISPHFDDAVLSCGAWLERHPVAVVATVCSGLPGPGVAAQPWDADAGFGSADEAVTARRVEDERALAVVGARQYLLGFLDGSYKPWTGRVHQDPGIHGPFGESLAVAIGDLVDELAPERCLAPLGLHHPDHLVVAEAARSALTDRAGCHFEVYADLPYAVTHAPERAVETAVTRLEAEGWAVTPVPTSPDERVDAKVAAVACYSSQLALLAGEHPNWRESLLPGAERRWRVSR